MVDKSCPYAGFVSYDLMVSCDGEYECQVLGRPYDVDHYGGSSPPVCDSDSHEGCEWFIKQNKLELMADDN